VGTSYHPFSFAAKPRLAARLARFSTVITPAKANPTAGTFTRVYGGLKDQDRIFTNIYGEHDTGIKGALARVRLEAL
jgi:NADH dehydrogenase (ubiquinone) flavoprotein 1